MKQPLKKNFFSLGVSTAPRKKKAKYKDCTDCKLYEKCKNPRMEVRGHGKKGILIIGEFPTAADDRRGKVFSGATGAAVWNVAKSLGLDLEKDCYFTHGVQCHPYSSSKKEFTKIFNRAKDICRHRLHSLIDELKPKVIIPMGDQAIDVLIGDRVKGRMSKTPRSAFIGLEIPDQMFKAWICPTYSPEYIETLRDPDDYLRMMKDHMSAAWKLSNRKLTQPYYKTKVTLSEDEAISWLRKARETKSYVAFDYETTGISPFRDGHRIVCASIAFGDTGYAFPFFQSNKFLREWKAFLTDKKIKTVAHNLGFEMLWTKVRGGLDYWPENIGWDTCLGAHCVANQELTSLKFQTYSKLGILGFDDDVDCFITKPAHGQDEKSVHSFNKIDECDLLTLLKYNAYDSLYTLHLRDIQEDELSVKQLDGFRLFMNGAISLAKVQYNGMRINVKELIENSDNITRKVNQLYKLIMMDTSVKSYGKRLDLKSNQQLLDFVYSHLKMEVPPEGKSVDEKALSRSNKGIIKLIIKYRKAVKIADFLKSFKRQQWEGVIHPTFALNTVKTFRSSSYDPNFQNIPKHDKNANKMIRGLVYPSPGCKLIEYDYKGVEVAVGATYHKDPNMIAYQNDLSTNFHTDTACDIFFRTLDTYTKTERQLAKNKMVFPSFYGSTAKPKYGQDIGVIARDLWEGSSEETIQHLHDNGIKNINDFQAHVLHAEEILWGERFPVYDKWRKNTWKRYRRRGYLDLYTGFRIRGPLSYTQAGNIQIQGTSFHCLLYTLTKVADRIQAISGRSYVFGQIHDAILINAHPEDEPEIDRIIAYYSTKHVAKVYPELAIVPLVVDKSITEIDSPWYTMNEIGDVSAPERISQIDLATNKEIKVWDSVSYVSIEGLLVGEVLNCCNSKHPSKEYAGFRWKYTDS